MRRAIGRYWDSDLRKYVDTSGMFHRWAARYDEFSSGPGNYTVALIEDDNGQIRECDPSTVRFVI